MTRVILVSNRLPLTVRATGRGVTIERATGGLSSGLEGPFQRSDAVWVGWPGDISSMSPDQLGELQDRLKGERMVPVLLDDAAIKGYYRGVANGVLWPTLHGRFDQVSTSRQAWSHYVDANRAFASAALRVANSDDVVWVHDYHLFLVPAMIRAERPNACVGFFLHVPFPSPDTFFTIPWARQILQGILGADSVGFHTSAYLQHFLAACRTLPETEVTLDGIHIATRSIRADAVPLGVDANAIARVAASPDVVRESVRLRAGLGGQRLLLGVDRMDYSKGIPRRLLAIDALLERRPDLVGKLRIIQVSAPSRAEMASYDAYRRSIAEVVGCVNGRWATASWVPIHNIERALSLPELASLYQTADVMVVSPLRDGLNLVAKEFIAARSDEDGVLLLSEFAGAASELSGAVKVNPFDVEGTAVAIESALEMPPAERHLRMQRLRERVFGWTADSWYERGVGEIVAAARLRGSHRPIAMTAEDIAAGVGAARNACLILDYDGTLVPFAATPEAAAPDAALLGLLAGLAAVESLSIHIVSGRPREALHAFLGHLPIHLHAEHGLCSRPCGNQRWVENATPAPWWKARIRSLLNHFVTTTPGSWIEEKRSSLAWHYRGAADREHAARRAHELERLIAELGSDDGVHALRGNRVIEVRASDAHKGLVVPQILAGLRDDCLVTAFGDDRTDEDLFRSLPEDSLTVHVGVGPARARASVQDYRAVRAVLGLLAEHRAPRSHSLVAHSR